MLHELIKGCFSCPVCGRILYFPLSGYWCPYCGKSITNPEQAVVVDFKNRITNRDENGKPYYCGSHSFNERAYPQDIKLTAIAEILEKLCQYEEAEEQFDKIVDEVINIGGET